MARNVEDDIEIRELVARYGHAVSERDTDGWRETWIEESEWNVLGHSPRGREDIVTLWLRLMAQFPMIVHRASDGIVRLEGDTATGTWAIVESGQSARGDGVVVLGKYEDWYVRTADGWRFKRRDFGCYYQGPPDVTAPLPSR